MTADKEAATCNKGSLYFAYLLTLFLHPLLMKFFNLQISKPSSPRINLMALSLPNPLQCSIQQFEILIC